MANCPSLGQGSRRETKGFHDDGNQAGVISFLSSPGALAAEPPHMVQTHSSIVFLAGDRAYKLKRAVRYSYLDYSTTAKRGAACDAEFTINRRFAPSLYLGVQPVCCSLEGGLSLDGPGKPVDWLVVMRRFDASAQSDQLAESGKLDQNLLVALADRLATLHAQAPVSTEHGGAKGLSRVLSMTAENLRADAVLSSEIVADWSRDTYLALEQAIPLLEQRRQNGKVRACHGDLHLRNICLLDGVPTPFDAIEFDQDLSTIDVLYDLSFLLMDLLDRGLEAAANCVMNRYLDRSGDDEGLALLPLFMSLRAAIRAQVSTTAAQRLQEAEAAQAVMREAARYLTLARRLLKPVPTRLVAIGGLSGAGKSTLAYALAPKLGRPPGARVLRSDILRKRLHGLPPEARLPKDAYVPSASAIVYAELAHAIQLCVGAGESVIADAVFLQEAERAAVAEAGRQTGVHDERLWLFAPLEQLIARVTIRRGDASDATADVVRMQALQAGASPVGWIPIDASQAPQEVQRTAEAVLFNADIG